MTMGETRPYEVPLFFRVQIIDDEVFWNREYRDFFTSFFVLEASRSDIPRENIQVVFTQDPEKGINRWAEEVFDLTLVDCDFSHWSKVEKLEKTDRFKVNAKRQGAIILRQLNDWVNGESARFSYRRDDKDAFWLWTGEVKEEARKLLKSYGFAEADHDYYLSKALSFEVLRDCVVKRCEKIIKNQLPVEQQIERLIYAIRMSNTQRSGGMPNLFLQGQSNPMGGVLRRVENTYKGPCLNGEWGVGDQKYRLAVFPKHPPKLSNSDRFLPLVGNVIAPQAVDMQISDLVKHLIEQEPVKDIDLLCKQYMNPKGGVTPEKAIAADARPQKGKEHPNILILKHDFPNKYFASATPLTGISVVGSKQAQKALVDKVKRLLSESFGGVILKTAYLDFPGQWESAKWPGIHVQSHMRSRALYPLTTSVTLWNTGRTAMETFPPTELNSLLQKLKESLSESQHNRVIVSLGSKFCSGCQPYMQFSGKVELKNLWEELFTTVFDPGLDRSDYPLVEINVRHYLREIVQKHLKGDEYLSPTRLDEIGQADPDSFMSEYCDWLHMLQYVAVKHKKKLIMKFPYRSDALGLIRSALAVRRLHEKKTRRKETKEYGIRGITVINALKTPVPKPDESDLSPYSQAWYANPETWGDAGKREWKYQMSGSLLAPYRNQLLAGILQPDILASLKEHDIALFISGGITSAADIQFIDKHLRPRTGVQKPDYGIQIGTWGLLSAGPGIGRGKDPIDWKNAVKPLPPARSRGIAFTLDCRGACCDGISLKQACENIEKDGQGQKASLINSSKCAECEIEACTAKKWDRTAQYCELKLRVDGQGNAELGSSSETRITPRICALSPRKCVSCGRCVQTFYCDAFLFRGSSKLPPLHDSRNCTGCGLCVQVCPTGALRLYRPKEMVVLISSAEERKEVLTDLDIAYIAYSPLADLENVPIGDSNAKIHCKQLNEFLDLIRDKPNFEVGPIKASLRAWVKETWDMRLGEKFVLGEGLPPDEYPDLRKERQPRCIESAETIVDLCADDQPERQTAIMRAIIWSQLIWSDPGQIFWDTPILIVQSRIENADTGMPIRWASGNEIKLDRDKRYHIVNCSILGYQGELILHESMSRPFSFEDYPKWYKDAKLGAGRLAKLDIRGYGNYLLKEFDKLTKEDIYSICGMPIMTSVDIR